MSEGNQAARSNCSSSPQVVPCSHATVPHIVALLGFSFHAAKIRTIFVTCKFWSSKCRKNLEITVTGHWSVPPVALVASRWGQPQMIWILTFWPMEQQCSVGHFLFLIIIVLWLYEADGFASLRLRWLGLQFCKGCTDSIELGPGALVNVVLIM